MIPAPTLLPALALALSVQAAPQAERPAPGPSPFVPPSLVAHAADADRSGDVDAVEWAAFLNALAPDDAELEPDRLTALLIAPLWDRDGSGALEGADLVAIGVALDVDRDGRVAAAELYRRGADGTRPELGDALLGFVLRRAADTNADGALDGEEWARAVADVERDGAAAVARWVAVAKIDPPGEAGAMSTGVILLGIPAGLDATGDGALTRADLEAVLTALDADGSGTLTRAEWTAGTSFTGPASSTGPTRERWERPTGDARERPCLVPWQRDLDDALALVAATGKPLLVCVNMDGEAASESLAWGRYRDPEFARLMSGFIPVLASPDRSNALDHDDRGRRIEDRRFGRLVCAEHIDVEPELFERYFDGTRVAPRHLAVAPDGEILFDRYLLQSFEPLEAELAEHGVFAGPAVEPELEDEAALLASPAHAHRAQLEAPFAAGDVATRARLASLALSDARATQHPELLRLALRDPDARVRREGAWTAARHAGRAPIELVPLAFGALDASNADAAARAALLDATDRLAQQGDPRAAEFWRVQTGLSLSSELVDPDRWESALAWAPAAPDESASSVRLAERLARLDERRQVTPDDGELAIAFAATALALSELDIAEGRDPTFLLEDARAVAEELVAQAGFQADARAEALAAWAAHRQGDLEAAVVHAEAAAPALLPWAGTPLAARLLEVLADLRLRAIYAAIAADEAWPAAWLADHDACRRALLAHPFGTAAQAGAWLDARLALGARADELAIAEAALARFPEDSRLHALWRAVLLRDGGPAGLERAGAALRAPRADLEPAFTWYEGLARFVAAERFVQYSDRAAALGAYRASAELFARAGESEPEFADSALHYVALARAGAAHLELEAGALSAAALLVADALETRPMSAEAPDGLGRTPAETARRALRELDRRGTQEELERLRTAMEAAGVGSGRGL